MIDSMLSVVDRLTALLVPGKTSDVTTFSEQIDPLFADLNQIYRDYLATLAELELVASTAAAQPLTFEACTRPELLKPLKEKVHALGKRLDANVDGTVRNFAVAVHGFFRLATKEGTGAAYTTLLDLVRGYVWCDLTLSSCLFTPARHVKEVRKSVDQWWSEIVKAHAQAKQRLVPQLS